MVFSSVNFEDKLPSVREEDFSHVISWAAVQSSFVCTGTRSKSFVCIYIF